MQIAPSGDNLHEISNTVFWGKIRTLSWICRSSVELVDRVVKVKIPMGENAFPLEHAHFQKGFEVPEMKQEV